MTRTTIMLPEEIKRRAVAEARRRKVSFANFVRQALAEQLPEHSKGTDHLKRRRQDPLFRLLQVLPPVTEKTPDDLAINHDDYLYGNKAEGTGR